MRIAVVGCGGVGGVIAANMTRAGFDVTPVTGNAEIAATIARDGYRVTDLDGTAWSIAPSSVPLASLPAEVRGRFDLCIVATQSTVLEAALQSVEPHLADRALVICCQNGLPEARAASLVGIDRVIGCVVGWGASMTAPGHYRRTSGGGFQIGQLGNARVDPSALIPVLTAVAPTRIVDDLAGVRWSKLAINCATTTLGAAGGHPLGVLLRHRFARRLALEIFAEVAAVAKCEGVKPVPVGGTLDIERIAISSHERTQRFGSPSLAYKHSILFAVGIKYRRMRSSMLYAIERGRQPEIDYLNGELVRRGRLHNVATPVNSALVDTVKAIVVGSTKPSIATLRNVHTTLAL